MLFLSKIFKFFLGPICFLLNFVFVLKCAPKQTRFLTTEESTRVDLLSENTSNFFGMVPTFGFRISIFENGGSQNIIKIWLSEVGQFLAIRELFGWPKYRKIKNLPKYSIEYSTDIQYYVNVRVSWHNA